MSSHWVSVFQGSIPEVITLQSTFEANGIRTYVPDMNLIQADPFMRGGNALALELFVPADREEEARALVPVRRKAGMAVAVDPPTELELLGKRVRWCTFCVVTAPIGFYFGLKYWWRVRKSEVRPAEHAWTMAGFWICFGFTILAPLFYLIFYVRLLERVYRS